MRIHLRDVTDAGLTIIDSDRPPTFSGRPASLTDALARNNAFTAALLPHSRHAVTVLNRRLRREPPILPSATTVNRQLYSSVALAVDRGALYVRGVDVTSRPVKQLARGGAVATRIALALEAYLPPRRRLRDNSAAIGWLYTLGRLEPVLRGFRPLSDIDTESLPTTVTRTSAARWFATLLTDDVAQEIAALLGALSVARLGGVLRPNPIFGGIGEILGSDGDWIVGDTLVELKCVVGGVRREHVAQLLCYYALDRLRAHGKCAYGFSKLALLLPRQRSIIHGGIADWLAAFGGPSAADLPPFVEQWCTTSARSGRRAVLANERCN